MSAVNNSTVEVRFFDGVQVYSYRGEEDHAKVIQIDTEHDEHIRVNLNDAPLFDGSPESDEPLAVKQVELQIVGVTLAQLELLAKVAHDDRVRPEEPIWVQLPDEEKKRLMDRMQVPLEIAGIVVEK